MLKIAILDQKEIGYDLDFSCFDSLGKVSFFEDTNQDELVERLRDFDVSIQNRIKFTAQTIEKLSRLRLICLTATGTNTIDLETAQNNNIAVCNIAGYSTNSVAQHTFAMLLEIMERLTVHDKHIKTKAFIETQVYNDFSRTFHEIAGKQWGIIGMGQIGRKTAEIAKAFGAKVVYTSPSNSSRKEHWPQLDKEELLKTSDIISIHSPINKNTRNYITSKELKLMKSSVILLNLGRGGIINEKDLAEALDGNLIAAAGLDVLDPEPPEITNPLLNLDHPERLLLSPHMAWSSVEARQRALDEIKLNIESFITGGKRNRV